MPHTAREHNISDQFGIEFRDLHANYASQAPSHNGNILELFDFTEFSHILSEVIEALHVVVVAGVPEAAQVDGEDVGLRLDGVDGLLPPGDGAERPVDEHHCALLLGVQLEVGDVLAVHVLCLDHISRIRIKYTIDTHVTPAPYTQHSGASTPR